MCACGMAGEHMASPIIAFLAGAGTGYLKQRNIEEQRKRDAEDQQFRSEQREAWRKQQADADALNGNLKNAQAPAEVVEGELGDQSAGPPVPATLVQPPAAVSGSAGMTPPIAGQSPADLPQGGAATPAVTPPAEAPPAMAPPVFRMVAPGGVNRTFHSSAEAQTAAKAYSSPEALNARFVAAYRGAGQLDKAQELENSFKRGQMADLQFSEAQKAIIAKDADASLRAAVGGGASSLSAFANQSGLFGKGTVGFDTGKDGKLQFYSQGADGTKAMLGQPVENTQEALSALVSPHWKSLDTSQYLGMLHSYTQAQRAQANDDRNYALSERKVNADIGHQSQRLSTTAGKASGKAGAASGFDWLDGFDPQRSRAAAHAFVLESMKRRRTTSKPMSVQEYSEAVEAAYRADMAAHQQGAQNTYIQGVLQRDLGSTKGNAQAYAVAYEKALKVAPADKLKEWGYEAPVQPKASVTEPLAPTSGQASKPAVPVLPAGSGLPAAAESAAVRLDQARADRAELLAGRAPGLKAGKKALDAHAKKVKDARAAEGVAQAEYQSIVAPFITAARVSRRN